ncbi:S-adenosyl-L-methionine-dependent methyltransferase [Triangularia verruculosa]|uniref:S-adenosyl-L-methionine-dependent methyltransferase n=1 Tax=Triangularia verruculosa TaxID=2587418 RepID=A0AAN6XQG3_9PEZI|nr:S-adenosyl-L-methionine-dependent methyltransferase [Triangularia verruculosa]
MAVLEHDTQRVEVDAEFAQYAAEAYNTDDSATLASSNTSLHSSLVNYEWKHGRRYHAYQAGSYSFPNDEREQERLDMIHHVFYRALGDRLFLAPINPNDGLRILDIGTGTGLWAIHLGEEYPGAKEIIGNDLSPIQPRWVPPNVRFLVDDVEMDWVQVGEGVKPYDYIHCRYMAGGIKDWPGLVKQMYDNLQPGGWVEFQESDNTLYSQDGTLTKDNAMVRMMDGLMFACDKIGRTMDPAPSMKKWAEDAGFINVEVQKFRLPVGSWPKDARLKEIGTLMAVNFIEGVEAFTAALCKDVLGWSQEEVSALNAEVKASAKRGNAHAIFDFLIITGQKPE